MSWITTPQCGQDEKATNACLASAHGRPQGGERAFAPPLEIGTKNQKLVENLKSTDLIVAITVYLPVWHLHCTRTRFTVLVSCSAEQFTHVRSFACTTGVAGSQRVRFLGGAGILRTLGIGFFFDSESGSQIESFFASHS